LGFPIVAGGLKGTANCTQIVQGYLAKIIALNPQVNAIITLNPSALMTARHHDMLIKNGTAKGDLFCIPVLLKDNYDTMDMPTTGGSLSLSGSQPSKGNNSNEIMYH
jgi:Asp-tRNA(Asn)/Glu-tRNA(Gln) amidotransferase A subunit family amidase